MIHFTQADKQMLDHMVDVVGDRMRHKDGYTEQDEATMTKLGQLAKAGSALVVDSATPQNYLNELTLFQNIVNAELDNWVPNASQRLIFRAGRALGLDQPDPSHAQRDDCGPDHSQHATIPDWVGSVYVHRCVSCLRIFRT